MAETIREAEVKELISVWWLLALVGMLTVVAGV
jgi:hypothetical protein